MNHLKLLVCFCVLLSFTIVSYGQTEAGRILLGGSSKLDFTSITSKVKIDGSTEDEEKESKFEFSPQIGVFITDGLALGIEIPVSSSTQSEDGSKYRSTSAAFAPFIRYYFGQTKVKPYLHGSAGLGSMKIKYTPAMGSSDETSGSLVLYQIGGGFGVFLNQRLSMDIGLSYSSATMKPKEDTSVDYRSVTSGIGLGVGLIILL